MKRATLLTFFLIALILSAFGQNVSILDASLKWNIGTHCWNEGPYNPYDRWTTSFLYTKGDTLMNGKHYKSLVSCADSICNKENLKSYIREETKQVFLANKIEEVLQFDFNLQKGSTMLMQLLKRGDTTVKYYIQVDSIKSTVWPDQKERKVQYVTVFDYFNNKLGSMSLNDVFVEGIGSLNYGLEYPPGLFITGDSWCFPTLLCFYSGNSLTYSNKKINNCYLSTGLSEIRQPELVQVATNNGMLEIQLTEANSGKLFVFDLNGRLILSQAINQSGSQFCLPSQGVYLYRFISHKGKVQTGKVLVK